MHAESIPDGQAGRRSVAGPCSRSVQPSRSRILGLGGCQSDGTEGGAAGGGASATASAFVEAGGAFPQDWPFAAGDQPVSATGGMVASTDEYASRVGVEILTAGGNAVDAAVATGLALAVVNPEAGISAGAGS